MRSSKAGENELPVARKVPEGFDFLIRKAAWFLVLSASETQEEIAEQFHQKARDCMIKAAQSPFFGGNENQICYEGLEVIREEVFELVSHELIRLGHRI